jgi:hypothetical protein
VGEAPRGEEEEEEGDEGFASKEGARSKLQCLVPISTKEFFSLQQNVSKEVLQKV